METIDKNFFKFIELPYPYKRPKGRKIKKVERGKIVCISDPHEPFSNQKIYDKVLNDDGNCETLLINGDFIDFYSKNRFRKTTYVSMASELRQAFKRLEFLANNFNQIVIIKGNHDDRLAKYLQDKIDGEADLLVFIETDIFRLMAKHFDNVQIAGIRLSEDVELTHLHQIGDAIFIHAELTRVQLSAITDYISRKLFMWKDVWNLKPYRIIAQGHNHIEGKWSIGNEKHFLIPTAANITSLAFKYIYSPNLNGRPPINGYSIFYQYNGETDYNRSHNIIIK